MKIRILILLAWMVLFAGCLVEETRHTLYLEPDGSVTWTVLESGVRSTASSLAERRGEEEGFLSLAHRGEHSIARGLDQLRPHDLRSYVLRGERPFTVFNEAWFASLEELAATILDQLEIGGSFEGVRDGKLRGFVLTIECAESHDAEGEQIDALIPLVTELANYKLVLPEGTFVEGVGFEIVDDGTGAVPVALVDEEARQEVEEVVYSLTWTIE